VKATELAEIDKEVFDLLGRPDVSALRVWEITGGLAEFDEDLLISNPSRQSPDTTPR
jgi:hypothetical protein